MLSVLQLAFAVYVRNVLTDAAAEGARFAALADETLADGAHRTTELIHAALSDSYPAKVSTRETSGVVEVTVSAAIPVLGPFGLPGTLTVHGHAARETFD